MYNFYSNNYVPDPHDVVLDVAHMLGMLSTLIGEGGVEHFGDRDSHGLSTLLRGLDDILLEAANKTAETISELKNDPGIEYREQALAHATKIAQDSDDAKAVRDAFKEPKTDDNEKASETDEGASYPKVAKLSTKQQMIVSTYKRGYEVKEIAKAVNLKAASVENMILQLKERGVLEEPSQDETLSQAVNG